MTLPVHAPTTAPLPALPRSAEDLQALSTEQWRGVLEGQPDEAARWLLAAARLGQAQAQAVLAQWLLDGRGLQRDASQALHWFQCAAQQGHVMAMNMVGRCHEQGWGTAVDAGKAAAWYRQAAGAGLAEAHYNLANLLASGQGVVQDHAAALALYRQATEQGYAKAYAKLGRYYEDGHGVPRDPDMALRCYQRGAEGGDFRGQFCYAGMLAAQGRQPEALRWLAQVADKATPRYLRQAGALLLQSPHADIQSMGRQMLARAETSAA